MHNTITVLKSHKKNLKILILWFQVEPVCLLVPLCCMCACVICATHERLRDQACLSGLVTTLPDLETVTLGAGISFGWFSV